MRVVSDVGSEVGSRVARPRTRTPRSRMRVAIGRARLRDKVMFRRSKSKWSQNKEIKECPAGGSFTSGSCFFFPSLAGGGGSGGVVGVLVAVVALGLGEIKWGKQEKDGRRSFPCRYAGTGQELVSYLPDGWMKDGAVLARPGRACRNGSCSRGARKQWERSTFYYFLFRWRGIARAKARARAERDEGAVWDGWREERLEVKSHKWRRANIRP